MLNFTTCQKSARNQAENFKMQQTSTNDKRGKELEAFSMKMVMIEVKECKKISKKHHNLLIINLKNLFTYPSGRCLNNILRSHGFKSFKLIQTLQISSY